MSTTDSMEKLKSLRDNIAKMKQEALELALLNKASIIEDIKLQIELCGITAEDLGFKSVEAKKEKEEGTRKPAEPKYRLNDRLWTGRGKTPREIADYITSGGTLADLLINKTENDQQK